MIVQQHPSGPIAIRQEDHAALAAFILEHWTDHNFPNNPERDQILLATREHDDGWRQLDDLPRRGADGLPVDFMSVTAEEAFGVWKRGSERFIDDDPFVALLIIHHGYSLYEHIHRKDPVWKALFTELAQQRAALRVQLGLTQNQVEHPYSYLRMADWFSLAWCTRPDLGSEKPERYGGYHLKRDGNAYLFRPYPFDERDLRYSLPVYPLRSEGYASDDELREAMSTPQIVEIPFNPLERWGQ